VDENVIDDVGFEFQRKLHRVIEVGKSRIAEVDLEPSTDFGPISLDKR